MSAEAPSASGLVKDIEKLSISKDYSHIDMARKKRGTKKNTYEDGTVKVEDGTTQKPTRKRRHGKKSAQEKILADGGADSNTASTSVPPATQATASTGKTPYVPPRRRGQQSSEPGAFTVKNARPQLITDYFPADGLDQGNIIPSAGDDVRGTRRSKRLQEKSAEPRSSLPPAESRQQRRTQTPIQFLLQRPLPAPFYLRNANQESKRMDSPRPLLVVLDLNGTLLCRKGRGSNFAARPRVNEFLEYLLSRHIVMVWSSARPVNVDNMCKKLFCREQMDQLVGVWARDKLNLTPEQYNEWVQVYKQLSWIWSDPTINGKRPWSQADTVLIDDSAEKAASEPHNVIEIEEFENRKDQLETDVLGQVIQYLDELSHQQDVSAYMRAHPFKWVPETKDGVDGKADTPMQ